MDKISMLVNRVNAFVDEYYIEQRLMDSDQEHASYHMHKMDRWSDHILGIRDAVNLLGYVAKFSDDMYPFSHVSAIVKVEEYDVSESN
jgi:hypothetical protein